MSIGDVGHHCNGIDLSDRNRGPRSSATAHTHPDKARPLLGRPTFPMEHHGSIARNHDLFIWIREFHWSGADLSQWEWGLPLQPNVPTRTDMSWLIAGNGAGPDEMSNVIALGLVLSSGAARIAADPPRLACLDFSSIRVWEDRRGRDARVSGNGIRTCRGRTSRECRTSWSMTILALIPLRSGWRPRTTSQSSSGMCAGFWREVEPVDRRAAGGCHKVDVATAPLASTGQRGEPMGRALARFLKDGNLPPDVDLGQQQIRGLVLGKRNCLFAGWNAGAEWAAILCSSLRTGALHARAGSHRQSQSIAQR
jgi:hypothetical protein